jgi:hypothetical protein
VPSKIARNERYSLTVDSMATMLPVMQYPGARLVLYCILVGAAACGPSTSGGAEGEDGCANRCTSFGWEQCLSPGTYADPVACAEGEVCIADLGCGVCFPGTRYCNGEEVWVCNDRGDGGSFVESCDGDLVCSNGVCKTPCERALDEPSNVGCEFWAVDLPNEAVDVLGGGFSNDAAAQQYAVAVANNNEYPVKVRVYRNDARVGQPAAEALVTEVTVAPNHLEQINLPQREVDGSMGQNGSYVKNSGSGSFVSPHAYRVESDGPIVAYQFNPIVQQFSNDASILIPIQALGTRYHVLGWPTANPCGPPPGDLLHQESIPDRTAVTVIGIHPNTKVTVIPTHPVAGSGGDSGWAVPQTPAGTPIEFTVGPFDVVNLMSDQPQVSIFECFDYLDRDGDLTGTVVHSSQPVAVFSSAVRGAGLGGANPPEPPDWDGNTCCTDHLEQQMFPDAALGWEFAVSRSPVRSTHATYVEPDLYRVLATENGTTVNTSLPAPNDRFELDAGEFRTFHAYGGFTVSSESGAIMVGQYLVSQGYIPQGGIGDPTFVVFPAAEQHRRDYVFLVPTTFSQNYMVLAKPVDATVMVNGAPLGEFHDCVTGEIGTIKGIVYEQFTCPMTEGVHRVGSNMPFGLSVYGYYNVGSYGYPGGSDVRIINPID